MDEILRAVTLGLVEGITEFLPISSTGHLILFGHALEFTGDFANSFEVMIQCGAILAVLVLYLRRFAALVPVNASFLEPGLTGSSGLFKLFLVSAPAAACGLLFRDKILTQLFNPISVACAFIVGAVLMLFIKEKGSKKIEEITAKDALIVGIAQIFALWPGMSRAACSILGGLSTGLSLKAATEFSFLAAVPLITAASLKELLDTWSTITSAQVNLLVIGFIVSFLSALLAVRVFVGIVSKIGLAPFAYYRLVLGAGVLMYFGLGH